MTEKLYDADSYATEFDACVTSCMVCDGGCEFTLDRTLFFPEEGGQCCDAGEINGEKIIHVRIEGDEIYHKCAMPFAVGESVHGSIDFSLRFRNMQNHSGEHILSGLAHNMYGCENVGFHLGADIVTMDFDRELTDEQLTELEMCANEISAKNLKITARYPGEGELAVMDYRSKKEIDGSVRIVEIDGVDKCACCAPHVSRTGEVGLIKIIDAIHYKGGMRLGILCGFDALADYRARCAASAEISKLLSAKQSEIAAAVRRMADENGVLKQQNAEKSRAIAAMIVQRIEDINMSDKCICIFDNNLNNESMRSIVNAAKAKTTKLAAVLSGSDGGGYRYVIGSAAVNMRDAAHGINAALGGRGGGSAEMISGSFAADRAKIEEYFDKF